MVTQSDGDGAGEQADSAKQSVNNSLTGTGVTSKREFVKAIKAAAPTTPASAVTPTAATPSNLVVIKNGDSSVQLDNQLKLSVDQTATLQKVTATNPDNFTYDEGSQTATLTDPTDTDAVTAEYKNVGTYRGKAISAQVTINNILKHTDDHPAPNSLPVNEIQLKFLPYFGGGIETYNVGQDEVTIKFFDEAGNQVAINGDGYITVGSLNGPSTSTAGNEYINYDNASTATYVTEDSVVKYQTNPLTSTGNAYVGTTNDFTDVLGAPTSENGAVTFQLSGNAFTFLSGTTRYTLKNANHHWSYTLTTFSSATVAPAVIPTPVLTVDKSSAKVGDTVTYTLDQQVNTLGEDTMLRYQSWSEVVTLPTEVSYQQASLLDSTGAVISDATFAWDAKTHQLTVTLPEDYLQNTMALNGETYQIKIGTTVNNGVVNGEVGPATGQVTIDNGSKASNGVSTVYVAPVVSMPVVPQKTVLIKIVDIDNRGQEIDERDIEGVIGTSYTISPLSSDARKIMYLDSTGPLTGVFTNTRDSKITLLYGRSYQVKTAGENGYTSLLTYNGRGDLILVDHQLDNGDVVDVIYDEGQTRVVWQNSDGKDISVKDISVKDSSSLNNHITLKGTKGKTLVVYMHDNTVPTFRVVDRKRNNTSIPIKFKKNSQSIKKHAAKRGDVKNETALPLNHNKYVSDGIENIDLKQTQSNYVDSESLPQTNDSEGSIWEICGMFLLSLLLTFGLIGERKNDHY